MKIKLIVPILGALLAISVGGNLVLWSANDRATRAQALTETRLAELEGELRAIQSENAAQFDQIVQLKRRLIEAEHPTDKRLPVQSTTLPVSDATNPNRWTTPFQP